MSKLQLSPTQESVMVEFASLSAEIQATSNEITGYTTSPLNKLALIEHEELRAVIAKYQQALALFEEAAGDLLGLLEGSEYSVSDEGGEQ